VLPELASTGYTFTSRQEAFAHAEPVPDGDTIRTWEAFAHEHGIHLVAGLAERDGMQLFDTAVLIGPSGYIGRYRKTHLWYKEKLWFTPGNEELVHALCAAGSGNQVSPKRPLAPPRGGTDLRRTREVSTADNGHYRRSNRTLRSGSRRLWAAVIKTLG